MSRTPGVLDEVQIERRRQDEKWGEQNHDATVWLTVLTEEVGEFAKEILERRYWLAPSTHHREVKQREAAFHRGNMRAEAIQCAAVAVAIVEWIDRGCPIDETDLGRS